MIDRTRERPGAGPGVEGGEHGETLNPKDSTARPPTHMAIILQALLRGERLTRLDAWREYGDGALNTTVSRLQARHGVRVDRERVTVPGRRRPAHVALYWLADDQHEVARKALATELAGTTPRGRGEGV